MRKFIASIFLLIGIVSLSYVGYELFLMKTGEKQAMVEAEQTIDETIVKKGGGTEPIALENGKTEMTIAEAQKNPLVSTAPITSEVLTKPQSYGDYSDGQSIGVLYIPRLDRSIPIIYGTDERELRKGVGFYKTTKLPGQNDQILLSGHRDTVFRQFDKLQIGDEFHVKMETGTYIYTIFATQIVDADDRTVIQSTYPNEVLTVSTCYPFNYIGYAPDRYILYAK